MKAAAEAEANQNNDDADGKPPTPRSPKGTRDEDECQNRSVQLILVDASNGAKIGKRKSAIITPPPCVFLFLIA